MHAGLLQNGRVVFLDKVENYSQIKLANGQYAYSAEYDPATNKVVGLSYKACVHCVNGRINIAANTDYRQMHSVLEGLSWPTVDSSQSVATLLLLSSIPQSAMVSRLYDI